MSRTSNGEISLLIDIGSQSVGGALIISGEKPEIIFSKRIRLPWSQVKNEERVGDMIIENLSELVQIIFKEGSIVLHINQHKLESKKIKRVLCTVSSPWCISETNVISKENEKSFEINSKSLDAILDQHEQEKIKQENTEYRLIEKKITKVKLNGYPTENFLNKEANKIEISTFDGRIREDFARKVENVLEHFLNSEVIFHTYTLASLTVLQDVFPNISDQMTIEITGGRTDVTVIEDNLIKQTTSFTRGTNSLLGRISDEYDVTPDIAMSFLKIYYEKRTEENFRNRIKKVVEEEKNAWIRDLQKASREMNSAPAKIFLTLDPRFQPFFEEYLKISLQDKRDSVVFTGTKALGQFCNTKNSEFDPFLFLGAIFLNKLYKAY